MKADIASLNFSLGACEELKRCINFFCYSVPVSLLLASLLSKSFEGPAGSADIPRTPAPCPKPHSRIVLVDEDTASPAVKSLFAEIRSATGADVIHTVYRAFARWPDFLQIYWTSVKPIAISELFQQSENAMRDDAIKIVGELPGPIAFNSSDLAKLGLNEADIGSLIRITDMFVHSLAAALLNVSVARVAMEGGCLLPKSLPEDSVPNIRSTQSS